MKNEILKFMETRPEVVAIIGYGSGVRSQVGQEQRKPQIDLIVVVDNLKKWHLENIDKNPRDYAFTGQLFFKHASNNFMKSGGKICYMTFIPYNGCKYKIGTIEKEDFLNDLNNWETFYMAGRMQKPILIVKADNEILKAIEYNRQMATLVTEMLASNKIQKTEFYMQLTGLSYIGDTRMGIAENPDKVKNIVLGSTDFYDDTYGKRVKIEDDYVLVDKKISIENLPLELKSYLKENGKTKDNILKFLTEKNKSQSVKQTIKGLFTTGPVKAIKYALEKLKRKKRK